MDERMKNGMAEATRLTREGRLAEATALIQRTLGGGSPPAGPARGAEVIETTSRIKEEKETKKEKEETSRPQPKSQPSSPLWPSAASVASPIQNLRTVPVPERPHRSAPRPPFGPSFGSPFGPPFGAPGTTGRSNETADAPTRGRFVEKSYSNRAGTRAYKLYVPDGYVGQEVPLVVMLHGCTQNPDDFAAGTRMNALADEHTFLVAYPAQSSGANMSKCWNWFNAGDQRRGQGEPSIIAGITCEVVGEYNVGSGRVYLAGMSAGGAMAAVVGQAYPDLYAAIGVHSGLAPGAANDLPSAMSAMRSGAKGPAHRSSGAGPNAGAVPVIAFHGDRDTTVHPSNADHLLAHFLPEDEAAHPARIQERQKPGGHAFTITTRRDAEGRAVAERWTVRGLGHAWSGGSRSGSYTDARGPDASAEMMRFFLSQNDTDPKTRDPEAE